MAGPTSDPKYQEYLQQLASLANEAAIGDTSVITFPGMLSGDIKWGAFSAAEVFVLPSHQENFGIAVAEALGCGTPVLISNKVNIWREIVDDRAGLADEDSLEGTSRLLERWLLLPEPDRQNMRAKARECFARRFDMAMATASLVQALSNSPSPP
jgi:glycosyltransferase involved in cell wall biosynthesis